MTFNEIQIEELKVKLKDATFVAMDKRELEMHCGDALIVIEELQRRISYDTKFIHVLTEEMVLAGLPGGDRNKLLNTVRMLCKEKMLQDKGYCKVLPIKPTDEMIHAATGLIYLSSSGGMDSFDGYTSAEMVTEIYENMIKEYDS